jgi:hypothetical protein
MLIAVAGCGGSSEEQRREEVRAKLREIHADEIAAVEGVFGRIIKARIENDYASQFDLGTPTEQDRLAGDAAVLAAALAPEHPQLKEALAEHGVDADRFPPIGAAHLNTPSSLRLALKTRHQELIGDLDDKRPIYLRLMPQVEPQLKELLGEGYAEQQQAMREAKLVDPIVAGDKVKAEMRTRIRDVSMKCVVTFKRIDGKWLLDTESVFNPVK